MKAHDALFKAIYSDPSQAATYFESFLPAALVACLDFARAELETGDLLDESVRWRYTDLLYRIPWRSGGEPGRDGGGDGGGGGEGEAGAGKGLDVGAGGEAGEARAGRGLDAGAGEAGDTDVAEAPGELLLFVLFEHQSTVDRWMAYRMLRYVLRIWDRWLKKYPRTRRLPPILPLVFYHGDRPWTAPKQLLELIAVPSDRRVQRLLRAHLPSYEFLFHEASTLPDERLRGRGIVRLALLLFRQGRAKELMALLPDWVDEIRVEFERGEAGLKNLELMVTYLLMVNRHLTGAELSEVLIEVDESLGALAMTLQEMLIKKSLKEGLIQGRQEGRQEEKEALARELLAEGMAPTRVAALTKLSIEAVRALTH